MKKLLKQHLWTTKQHTGMHTCVEMHQNVLSESVKGFFGQLIGLQNVRKIAEKSLLVSYQNSCLFYFSALLVK